MGECGRGLAQGAVVRWDALRGIKGIGRENTELIGVW